ncbi:hypothetical protein ACFTSD_25050 [Nocardiaceae bacterium NPDC056970]
MWQNDFSEFETAGGGIWRIRAVIDHVTKYCLAITVTPTVVAVDAVACIDLAVAEAQWALELGDLPWAQKWEGLVRERLDLISACADAVADPLAVLATLMQAEDADAARTALSEKYGWSQIQASAVMAMQFRRVTAADRRLIVDGVSQLRRELEQGPPERHGP